MAKKLQVFKLHIFNGKGKVKMNKSISDSIKRFRPSLIALPELIKGIVNIIENDLNE